MTGAGLFERVLVANRGEIALRVTATLRHLGIGSVSVYTGEDRLEAHVACAEEAVALRSPAGYLDVDAIVGAALRCGADALHPGYGFLAENPALARACAEAGITFIGPPPEAIELMGDKIRAKRLVAGAGVPVVPGVDDPGLDDESLADAAAELGLPVLLKPSAGGGGKGMRRVDDPDGLRPAIAAARREALAAFGDATLLAERYLEDPRHIEIQVFADVLGTTVSLGERECSLQRRHQKIVEESPSPLLRDDTRAQMAKAATAAARACGYVGAGTVELIVSARHPGEFFFMEMNTRLQVEHRVTELVLGIDLVEWQIRVAAGQPLPWADAAPTPRGHAVEARVYAEDPSRGFLPSSGKVLAVALPTGGESLRVDTALAPGGRVGTSYDPMVAKVVAWGEDRPRALRRLDRALADTAVLGFTTNVGFLRRLVGSEEVRAGRIDTGLVERRLPELLPGPAPDEVLVAAAMIEGTAPHPVPADPWLAGDGWRLGEPAPRRTSWDAPGHRGPVEVLLGRGWAQVAGTGRVAASSATDGPRVLTEVDGVSRSWLWASDGDELWLASGGDSWRLVLRRETRDALGPRGATRDGRVTSPMPGTVIAVHVGTGAAVRAGEPLLSVEAMKMEHVVTAPSDGTVSEMLVGAGEAVRLDQHLATVEADEPS